MFLCETSEDLSFSRSWYPPLLEAGTLRLTANQRAPRVTTRLNPVSAFLTTWIWHVQIYHLPCKNPTEQNNSDVFFIQASQRPIPVQPFRKRVKFWTFALLRARGSMCGPDVFADWWCSGLDSDVVFWLLFSVLSGVPQRMLIWNLELTLPHTAFSLRVGAFLTYLARIALLKNEILPCVIKSSDVCVSVFQREPLNLGFSSFLRVRMRVAKWWTVGRKKTASYLSRTVSDAPN